ncbi:G-protein coupled receptors family 1 profile domain-containing protein [Caenorhabditis elegans]|uniref:G-protein coupled receptors family 1 profile domain-containing protein n=1 Tax=Caenorhabditis elegans TaxID=6239 RepID=O62403_CAEEL|nr:G-protein coupled receptors family 1 profile domain-containing protein [Caenorhabditis elegans]CAA16290.4 G-protein coupled receptors family 1 profile domain-containing protein [Caenorhabditis elegans]|eukprot:NP_503056.4 NeuroPeptide Receptor family [Caenorhabditis elegans]
MNISTIISTTTTPPAVSNEDDTSRTTLKLVLAISYLVLFIIGTVGNGTVILMIINILTSMKRNVQAGKRMMSSTNHVFIYVLGLSIVDLLVILHLPFLVVDLLKGQWLFGVAMCKVYWFGESVNKLLSSFLMTVLSWDRYMAVCSPVKSMKMRSNATALKVLLACTIFATVLLLPVLYEAAVFKIDKMRMVPLLEGTEELAASDLAGTTMSKCMFDADATFTLYTFVIGFAAPAFLIIIFYVQVIYALQKSSRNIRGARGISKPDGSSNRVKKVTKRIVAVILFYFLCWTPQWTLNIMSQFNLIAVSWMTPALSAMFFVAHLLVCFNSAANPVLYAYINRELRSQHVMAMHRKRHSLGHEQQQRLNQARLSMQSRPSDASATVFSKLGDSDAGIFNRLSNFQQNIIASILHRKRIILVADKNIHIENTSSSTDEDKDDYL